MFAVLPDRRCPHAGGPQRRPRRLPNVRCQGRPGVPARRKEFFQKEIIIINMCGKKIFVFGGGGGGLEAGNFLPCRRVGTSARGINLEVAGIHPNFVQNRASDRPISRKHSENTSLSRPVHAGGVGLCEMVQHLQAFDFVRLSGTAEGRMVEYVNHLHQHFVFPPKMENAK